MIPRTARIVWWAWDALLVAIVALEAFGHHQWAVWLAWFASAYFLVFEFRLFAYSRFVWLQVHDSAQKWAIGLLHPLVVLWVMPYGVASYYVAGVLIFWLPFHLATGGAEAKMIVAAWEKLRQGRVR